MRNWNRRLQSVKVNAALRHNLTYEELKPERVANKNTDQSGHNLTYEELKHRSLETSLGRYKTS